MIGAVVDAFYLIVPSTSSIASIHMTMSLIIALPSYIISRMLAESAPVIYNLGLRFGVERAFDALRHDVRPPIILLRSFVDDRIVVKKLDLRVFFQNCLVSLIKPSFLFWWYAKEARAISLEDVLAGMLSKEGPVDCHRTSWRVVSPFRRREVLGGRLGMEGSSR